MSFSRRQFLQTSLSAAALSLLQVPLARGEEAPSLKLATFRFDVSPPEGHPLCGGWIKPVVGQDDPQEAIGLIITGAGAPIVVCAVDWTGLLNEAHIAWRKTLAQAAGTTPERVAVQCVHQHNAPFVCLEAETIVAAAPELGHHVDRAFFDKCLERGAEAVTASLAKLRPLTHIATGQGKVEQVASNRRFIGENGTVVDWRGSASKNPKHKELPEGLIDPWLKTVAFYDGEEKIAACHYYATHPMSYYGDGRVTSDFVGLARRMRETAEPNCTHIYFTGCSGNIAAGKYNDGTPEARKLLTERVHAGMLASEEALVRQPITQAEWLTQDVVFTPRATFKEENLLAITANPKAAAADRFRSAMMTTWLRRCLREEPIVLSALHINQATLLHLPAECFLEYQLRAQEAAPDRFVATAAYGDGGPWYIPIAEAYPQGGYEVSVAFSEPTVDALLTERSAKLLTLQTKS